MAKFKVFETTEIRSEMIIEANDAQSAINKAKRRQHTLIPKQSVESHYRANVIKEEN